MFRGTPRPVIVATKDTGDCIKVFLDVANPREYPKPESLNPKPLTLKPTPAPKPWKQPEPFGMIGLDTRGLRV